MIPRFLAGMVKKVCGICPSHGHTGINFDRKHDDNFTTEKIDLVFPVGRLEGEKSFKGYKYIPIVEVPGFVLIKTINSKPIYVRAVTSSLLDCWPLLCSLHLNDDTCRNSDLGIGKLSYFHIDISTILLTGI